MDSVLKSIGNDMIFLEKFPSYQLFYFGTIVFEVSISHDEDLT
jgi:hypothetical protein